MIEDVQAAIPLGFIMSFMIGPVFFVLLETSALKGFRAAIVFNSGVIIADILFLVIAYFSSRQLLENLSNRPGLYVLGGVILIIYGILLFVKKQTKNASQENLENTTPPSKGYLGLFIKGFLLNFINVGVLVFWLGLIIVVGPSVNNDPIRIRVFFISMLLTYFIVDIFKILLAKQLKRKLTPKRIHLIKKGLGVLLFICGLVLGIKGFLPKDQFNINNGIKQMEQIRE